MNEHFYDVWQLNAITLLLLSIESFRHYYTYDFIVENKYQSFP